MIELLPYFIVGIAFVVLISKLGAIEALLRNSNDKLGSIASDLERIAGDVAASDVERDVKDLRRHFIGLRPSEWTAEDRARFMGEYPDESPASPETPNEHEQPKQD